MGSVINDIIRVDVVGAWNDQVELVNSYQFQQTNASPLSDGDILDDMATFFEALYDAIKAMFAVVTIWKSIRARNLTTNTLIGEQPFDAAVTGTAASNTAVPGAAMVARFPTNVSRVQLRKFIGPFAEGVTDEDGLIDSSFITTAAAALDDLLAVWSGTNGSYRYGVLSSKTGTFVVPNALVIGNIPGYQRRRKPGVGV